MKVILNHDVHNLGEEGDVCEVAPGYARNYLLPKNLAVAHTKGNLALFESRRAAIEARKEEKRKEALTLKEQLEEVSISIETNTGDTGRLFGSVTSATIAEELAKLGYTIDRKKIEIPDHSIKMAGLYKINVKLYDGNMAVVSVDVSSPEFRKYTKTEESPVADVPESESEESQDNTPQGAEAEGESSVEDTSDDSSPETE